MIGTLIVGHEGLPEAYIKTLDSLTTFNMSHLLPVSIRAGEPTESAMRRIEAAADAVDDGYGVLILSDQLGSSPANVSAAMCKMRRNVVAICGVNMPMLIRILDRRASVNSVEELADAAVQAGRENIVRLDKKEDCAASSAPEKDAKRANGSRKKAKKAESALVLKNRLGLHASAAAKLVHVANGFSCEIEVEKERKRVNAKSILGVLTLTAHAGDSLTFFFTGEDAEEAAAAVERLIEDKFGEES